MIVAAKVPIRIVREVIAPAAGTERFPLREAYEQFRHELSGRRCFNPRRSRHGCLPRPLPFAHLLMRTTEGTKGLYQQPNETDTVKGND